MSTIQAETIRFDTDLPGTLPQGWAQGVTGRGKSRWTVEQDPPAPSKPPSSSLISISKPTL